MQENTICPGCGRHCDLERPYCGRGEEYRRTGKMPERQEKQQDLEMHTANDPAEDINDSLIISLRDLHHTMHLLHEEMLSCLSGEEKQELLSLLEKVRCDWKKRYIENENTFKHGHRHGGR